MESVDYRAIGKVAERLRDDEVHVWRLPYDRAAGRAPLLALLAAYAGMSAGELRLVAGPFGRPAWAPGRDHVPDFNWSHSGTHALVALARGIAPGIDVEHVRARPRALEIAQRYFAPAEAARLAALPVEERNAAFLRLWTAKEAVLKALGRGLAFGLHRLDIDASGPAPYLLALDGEHASDWQLHALDTGDDLFAALAWRGGPRRIRAWSLAER